MIGATQARDRNEWYLSACAIIVFDADREYPLLKHKVRRKSTLEPGTEAKNFYDDALGIWGIVSKKENFSTPC